MKKSINATIKKKTLSKDIAVKKETITNPAPSSNISKSNIDLYRSKILLFKIGALGDAIMTTPLICALRSNLPHAQIDYLIGKRSAPVLENNPNLDNILTFEEEILFSNNPFKKLGILDLIKTIREGNYDIIFVLDKHWIFGMIAKLAGVKIRIGFDRMGNEGVFLTDKVYFDGSIHEIKYYLSLIEPLRKKVYNEGIPSNYSTSTFINYSMHKRDVLGFFKKFSLDPKKTIAITIGGGRNIGQVAESKIWSFDNHIILAKKLISKGYRIIYLGDKNDKITAMNIIAHLKPKNFEILDLCGTTSISKTAAIMDICKYTICNDSGPMHIASTTRTKIIAIFGPTNPDRFAPLDKRSKYLWNHLECCPSNDIYGKFNKCKNDCINRVKPIDVLMLIK